MARRANAADVSGVVSVEGREVAYEVVRSDRARRVRLRVGPNPVVEIIAPRGVKLGDVAELLQPHHRWILDQFVRLEQKTPQTRALESGTMLPFRGKELTLHVSEGPPDRCTVSRRGNKLFAYVPPDNAALLSAGLDLWFREQARYFLHERARHWAPRMGVQYKRITIRDQKTRWGSCSSLGNLNFSWRLVMAPTQVLDYVVIHELAHLVEPNHGDAFWRKVRKYTPKYQEHVQWLHGNGARLASYFVLE